jgi:hypothetical protein
MEKEGPRQAATHPTQMTQLNISKLVPDDGDNLRNVALFFRMEDRKLHCNLRQRKLKFTQ